MRGGGNAEGREREQRTEDRGRDQREQRRFPVNLSLPSSLPGYLGPLSFSPPCFAITHTRSSWSRYISPLASPRNCLGEGGRAPGAGGRGVGQNLVDWVILLRMCGRAEVEGARVVRIATFLHLFVLWMRLSLLTVNQYYANHIQLLREILKH